MSSFHTDLVWLQRGLMEQEGLWGQVGLAERNCANVEKSANLSLLSFPYAKDGEYYASSRCELHLN